MLKNLSALVPPPRPEPLAPLGRSCTFTGNCSNWATHPPSLATSAERAAVCSVVGASGRCNQFASLCKHQQKYVTIQSIQQCIIHLLAIITKYITSLTLKISYLSNIMQYILRSLKRDLYYEIKRLDESGGMPNFKVLRKLTN